MTALSVSHSRHVTLVFFVIARRSWSSEQSTECFLRSVRGEIPRSCDESLVVNWTLTKCFCVTRLRLLPHDRMRPVSASSHLLSFGYPLTYNFVFLTSWNIPNSWYSVENLYDLNCHPNHIRIAIKSFMPINFKHNTIMGDLRKTSPTSCHRVRLSTVTTNFKRSIDLLWQNTYIINNSLNIIHVTQKYQILANILWFI